MWTRLVRSPTPLVLSFLSEHPGLLKGDKRVKYVKARCQHGSVPMTWGGMAGPPPPPAHGPRSTFGSGSAHTGSWTATFGILQCLCSGHETRHPLLRNSSSPVLCDPLPNMVNICWSPGVLPFGHKPDSRAPTLRSHLTNKAAHRFYAATSGDPLAHSGRFSSLACLFKLSNCNISS